MRIGLMIFIIVLIPLVFLVASMGLFLWLIAVQIMLEIILSWFGKELPERFKVWQ